MKLNNQELYEFLIEKEIHYLFHANTVATSITFIQQDGLLSRGDVESKGLIQTPQPTDDQDKKVNVWNDIFIDTIDLHGHFPRQNFYGPVLFKFSTRFIIERDIDIWITRDNPKYWTETMNNKDKYFVDVSELREKWDMYQLQKKMVTIRNQNEPILFDYLLEIIIDDPQRQIGEIILFKEAIKGILEVLGNNSQLLKKRICRRHCYCLDNYQTKVSEYDLKRLFLPSNHL